MGGKKGLTGGKRAERELEKSIVLGKNWFLGCTSTVQCAVCNVWAEKIPEKGTKLRNFNDCALLKLSKDPLLKHFYFFKHDYEYFSLVFEQGTVSPCFYNLKWTESRTQIRLSVETPDQCHHNRTIVVIKCGSFSFLSNSQTAPLFPSSTDGAARIFFLPPYAEAGIGTKVGLVASRLVTF